MTDPGQTPADPAQPDAAGRTDQHANDEITQQPAPGTEQHSGNDESGKGDDPIGREKTLRKRAQAAESERDRLASIVETYQRAEVENVAAETMTAPADLWATGQTLDDLLDDAGNVDPDKVREVTGQVIEQRPHWGKRGPKPDPSQGARQTAEPRRASWSEVISGQRR